MSGLLDSYRHGGLSCGWTAASVQGQCCAMCTGAGACLSRLMGSGDSALWVEVVRKHKTLIADVISEKCHRAKDPVFVLEGLLAGLACPGLLRVCLWTQSAVCDPVLLPWL